MPEVALEKVYAGYRVDGLILLQGNCGCGLAGPEGVSDCCETYSRVRQDGNVITFFAIGITSQSTNNYKSYYRVKKGAVEVEVLVYDSRNPKNFIFGGYYPPPLSAWREKGWQVLQQMEEPLIDNEMAPPEWTRNA